jgi:hypothetical protein
MRRMETAEMGFLMAVSYCRITDYKHLEDITDN